MDPACNQRILGIERDVVSCLYEIVISLLSLRAPVKGMNQIMEGILFLTAINWE